MVERSRYDSYVSGTAVLKPIIEHKVEVKSNKTVKPNKASKSRAINIEYQKRILVGLFLSFALLMGVTYRGNLINEKNLKLSGYKDDVKKQNDEIVSLNLDIEKTNDINSIEQYAKEKLGMQKPQTNQMVYIDLGSEDHIAKTESETVTQSNSALKSVKDYIANVVKIVE